MKADRNIKIDGVWYRCGDELPEQKVSEPVKAAEPEPVAEPEPEPVTEPESEPEDPAAEAQPEEKPEAEKPKNVRTSANRRKANAK